MKLLSSTRYEVAYFLDQNVVSKSVFFLKKLKTKKYNAVVLDEQGP
jgi:hypothetical protein